MQKLNVDLSDDALKKMSEKLHILACEDILSILKNVRDWQKTNDEIIAKNNATYERRNELFKRWPAGDQITSMASWISYQIRDQFEKEG